MADEIDVFKCLNDHINNAAGEIYKAHGIKRVQPTEDQTHDLGLACAIIADVLRKVMDNDTTERA